MRDYRRPEPSSRVLPSHRLPEIRRILDISGEEIWEESDDIITWREQDWIMARLAGLSPSVCIICALVAMEMVEPIWRHMVLNSDVRNEATRQLADPDAMQLFIDSIRERLDREGPKDSVNLPRYVSLSPSIASRFRTPQIQIRAALSNLRRYRNTMNMEEYRSIVHACVVAVSYAAHINYADLRGFIALHQVNEAVDQEGVPVLMATFLYEWWDRCKRILAIRDVENAEVSGTVGNDLPYPEVLPRKLPARLLPHFPQPLSHTIDEEEYEGFEPPVRWVRQRLLENLSLSAMPYAALIAMEMVEPIWQEEITNLWSFHRENPPDLNDIELTEHLSQRYPQPDDYRLAMNVFRETLEPEGRQDMLAAIDSLRNISQLNNLVAGRLEGLYPLLRAPLRSLPVLLRIVLSPEGDDLVDFSGSPRNSKGVVADHVARFVLGCSSIYHAWIGTTFINYISSAYVEDVADGWDWAFLQRWWEEVTRRLAVSDIRTAEMAKTTGMRIHPRYPDMQTWDVPVPFSYQECKDILATFFKQEDSTHRKMLRFMESDQFGYGGIDDWGETALRKILDGYKLAALTLPVDSAESVALYSIFYREGMTNAVITGLSGNRDVVDLVAATKRGTVARDIASGVAYGYPADAIVEFLLRRMIQDCFHHALQVDRKERNIHLTDFSERKFAMRFEDSVEAEEFIQKELIPKGFGYEIAIGAPSLVTPNRKTRKLFFYPTEEYVLACYKEAVDRLAARLGERHD